METTSVSVFSADSVEVDSGLTEKSAADPYYIYRELERYDTNRRPQRAVLIQGLPIGHPTTTATPNVTGTSLPTSNAPVGSLEYLSLIEGLDPKSRQYQRNKAASKRRRDENKVKRNSWIRFRSWVSLLLDTERSSEVDGEQQQHDEAVLEELQQQWRQSHLPLQSSEGPGEQRLSSPPTSYKQRHKQLNHFYRTTKPK
ncbi:hypothetical protein DFQ26_006392 [Actinomortierella ambigua]|nr:hypothetical protein DFQ26_006392 [Actinomortierella ambigua]